MRAALASQGFLAHEALHGALGGPKWLRNLVGWLGFGPAIIPPVKPSFASIWTARPSATALVWITKLAVVAPALTNTLRGTDATPGLRLARSTCTPPATPREIVTVAFTC